MCNPRQIRQAGTEINDENTFQIKRKVCQNLLSTSRKFKIKSYIEKVTITLEENLQFSCFQKVNTLA